MTTITGLFSLTSPKNDSISVYTKYTTQKHSILDCCGCDSIESLPLFYGGVRNKKINEDKKKEVKRYLKGKEDLNSLCLLILNGRQKKYLDRIVKKHKFHVILGPVLNNNSGNKIYLYARCNELTKKNKKNAPLLRHRNGQFRSRQGAELVANMPQGS